MKREAAHDPGAGTDECGRLSAYLSHRIRNPLAASWNVLHHLCKRASPDGETAELLRIIEEEVYCFKVLSDELDLFAHAAQREWSRVPLGRFLADAWRSLVEECGPIARRTADLCVTPPDLEVETDAALLSAVTRIVLFHVTAATSEEGPLRLFVAREGAGLGVIFRGVPRSRFAVEEGQLERLLATKEGSLAHVSFLALVEHCVRRAGGSVTLRGGDERTADLVVTLPAR